MVMKVYQNGDVCEIDQSGEPLLQIPLQYCSMSIIGNDVRIFNQLDDTIQRSDLVAHVQNQAGSFVGDIYDVVKYLNTFIKSGFTNAKLDDSLLGGVVTDGQNLGGGSEVFKDKTNTDLNFRTLTSNDFELTQNTNDVQIDADANMISNQPTVIPTSGMETIINDGGTLKKADVSSFLGGGASFGFDKTKNAFYFPGTNRVDYAYRTNGGVNINVLNVIGFNIYGQVDLESLSIDATSTLVANLISCVYKYDYATNNWNKIAQSTPYTTGISGLQTYTLPSTVTLENGLYFAGILSDANATNLSGIQANGLYNAFGYATTPLNLAAVDKWYKYTLTYTTTLPSTISGYPTGFVRQTSGNVAMPLLKFN